MIFRAVTRLLATCLLLLFAGLASAQTAVDMPVSSSVEGETAVFKALGDAKRLHKKGKNKKAARLLRRFLAQGDSIPFTSTIEEYAQIYELFSHRKPYRWKRKIGVSFAFSVDTLASGESLSVFLRVPTKINGCNLDFTFDSGSSINLLTPALADSLNLERLGLTVPFEGEGSGHGELAIADELRLGEVRLRHVPFVVADVSTGNDSLDLALSHLHAIIGLPILEALHTAEIDFRLHRMKVIEPLQGVESNLVYDDDANELLVTVRHHDEQLLLIPDFGASHTILGADYFGRHRDWIQAYCQSREVFFAGVGGMNACREYAFPQFDVKLGQLVFTLPTATVVDIPYDNRLGMDFFSRCQRVVFDFTRMSLLVY